MKRAGKLPPLRPESILKTLMPHRITLERNTLRFAAAHFTTFAGECEPLHGHNYDVLVELQGELTPDSWVVDFGEAKRIVRELCQELDHKFLLPALNQALTIDSRPGEVEVTFGDKRYVIPESDVARLDIDNSTAERLAEWFAGRIASALKALGARNVAMVKVGVEEMPGQAGWYRMSLGGPFR